MDPPRLGVHNVTFPADEDLLIPLNTRDLNDDFKSFLTPSSHLLKKKSTRPDAKNDGRLTMERREFEERFAANRKEQRAINLRLIHN